MPNEQEQFLKDLETDGHNPDPFAHVEQTPENGTTQANEDQGGSDDSNEFVKPRNRRERRLEEKLRAEREAGIQLAAQLAAEKALRESTSQTQTGSDALKAIERIYGTESPEAREATEILRSALQEVKESAKREALEAYSEQSNKEREAVADAERQLDEMVEEIEDEYDVDLTSPEGQQARTDFFKLLERMSPKDKDGNILYYADHISIWEDYLVRTKRQPDTTARDLSSRSMTQSGGSAGNSTLNADTTERYLRENGII